MNIQQLEYITAVKKHHQFARAAEACHISQPTLSAMIQKLEEELGVKIFDRSKHPIEPTPIGNRIVEQARVSLRNIGQIREIVESERNMAKGTFKLGVIPTIAPYMIPELLNKWRDRPENYGDIELAIKESSTERMIEEIMAGNLDGGLLAGPLNHSGITELPLYYERFYAYVSKEEEYRDKEIDLEQVDINSIWLLENIHCFRGQIERLCRMKRNSGETGFSVRYEAGSIDTLINIVDCNGGMTIIPEMLAMSLSEERQENLRMFKGLTAVREVSLMTNKDYLRTTMLNAIADIISQSAPKSMLDADLKKYVVEL